MDIKTYLNRIKYEGNIFPNLETLKNLQKNHLLNVPFENLDIHYQTDISLNVDRFYQKVVKNGRGGFCYELNSLFNELLNRIGFVSKIVSARVFDNKIDDFGKEFDHLVIIVELNKTEYLVDVGFGEFAVHPLVIELDSLQSDSRGIYIIEKYDNEFFVVSKIEKELKNPQYIFSNRRRELSEFTDMCRYHQKSPDSHFTHNKLISKPIENGRITISGNSLKITKGDSIEKEVEFANDEFEKYVKDWFNIDDSSYI